MTSSEQEHGTLPEEYHAKWHAFLEGLNRVVEEVFGTDEDTAPALVVGIQFAVMGSEEHPEIVDMLASSNVHPCAMSPVIADLAKFFEVEHDRLHRHQISNDPILAPVDISTLPPGLLEQIQKWAEEQGVDPEAIEYVQAVSLADLDADVAESFPPEG